MISQGEGCREDVGGGGWQHTRQTLEKSPTSKLYTTWAHILSDRNVFAPRGGGGETAGSNTPGAFLVTPPSGRGLVIPVFFIFHFFGGHLPQTSGFCSAKHTRRVFCYTGCRRVFCYTG